MKLKTAIVCLFLILLISGVRAQQDQVDKYLSKAAELIDQHDYETAVVMCTYAVKSDSSRCESFYLRGLCFNKIGNQNAALRDLNQSIKLNSGQIEAFILRSRVNQSLGNIKQSVADLNKARSIDPVGTTIYLARRFFKSILP